MFEIFSDKSSKSAFILDPDGIKSCEARLKELQIPVIKVLVDAPDEACIQRQLYREADSGEIQKRMAELRNPAAWRNSNKGLEYTMVLNSERRTPLEITHYIFKATKEMYTPVLSKPPVTDQEAECLIAAARQYQISFHKTLKTNIAFRE
ncbi:hypothetical protein I3271_07585 [Photobacterium leiognathi]|uniref:hypothetical protein n=1 Tax=Photobacterium leiognathi TaxID=553611 RepID=UPI001EDEF1B1|nr:hypothetical protein [Photobacterium leiognathi]MCG3884548.1 hypothetical protein [Photobacterium leiognathi]